MNIPIIKSIVERYSIEELEKAEAALIEEQSLPIEIEGHDEGEQLTHILAALWIKGHMEETGENIAKAVRAYSVKVRKSIS
jgi:hypothetical protein